MNLLSRILKFHRSASLQDIARYELFSCVAIETMNICNRKCFFCKFGQPRQAEKAQRMDWAMIQSIIRNLSDLNFRGRVSWYKINEPLLDKRLPDIIALTRKCLPRAYLAILTNGDYIDDSIYERLKTAGINKVGVSVYDDATAERISGFIFRAEWQILDQRPGGKFMPENRGGNIKFEKGSGRELSVKLLQSDCKRPSTMLNILPNGDVVLCCADFYGDVVMGNVKTSRLEEIWYGKKFMDYRNHLRSKGRQGLKLCGSCSHSGKGHKQKWPGDFS